MNSFFKQSILPTLSLFTSFGTLVCCALPALLVSLGMGAAVAGLVSNAPWLVYLSDHKPIVFLVVGILLAASTFLQWRGRNAPCPIDPKQAKACTTLRKISWGILVFSIITYAIGFFFAFFAAKVFFG